MSERAPMTPHDVGRGALAVTERPLTRARLFDLRVFAWRNRRSAAMFAISSLMSAALEGITYPLLLVAVSLLAGDTSAAIRSGVLGRTLSGTSVTGAIAIAFACVVGFQVLRAFFFLVAQGCSVGMGRKLEDEVRQLVIERLYRTPFHRLQQLPGGTLSQATISGPREASTWLQGSLQQLVSLFMLAVYAFLMVAIVPLYTLAAAVVFGCALLVARYFLARTRRVTAQLLEEQTVVSSVMLERLGLMRLVYGSGAEERTSAAMTELGVKMSAISQRRLTLSAAMGPAIEVVLVCSLGALVLTMTGITGATGSSTVAPLLLFVTMFQRAGSRLQGSLSRSAQTAAADASLTLLATFVDDLGELEVRSGIAPSKVSTELRLERVTLRHETDRRAALDALTLSIPAGKTTALVGATGSGKSTILDLLQGLVSPTSGAVLVDGCDLTTVDSSMWRRRIAVVSQETHLLDDTLRENICFGLPANVPHDAIVEAARLAGALAFIEALPNGFDTKVGQRGFRLSGGERQKIALARACLRKPTVLLLDEPTSALDIESERAVMEGIESISQDCTVVVAAHRLSTIMYADHIVVLHEGRCIESGTHDELIAAGGLYARLFRLQSFTAEDRASARALA